MRSEDIAYIYARAFFNTLKDKEIQKNQAGFENIAKLQEANAQYRRYLVSPILTGPEKKMFLKKTLEQFIDAKLMQFLLFLIDKRKIGLLSKIAGHFKKMCLEASHIVEVRTETALPLEEKAKEKLKEKLEEALHKNVVFDEVVNPPLIGGILLKINSKTFDFSLKDRLDKMRLRFI